MLLAMRSSLRAAGGPAVAPLRLPPARVGSVRRWSSPSAPGGSPPPPPGPPPPGGSEGGAGGGDSGGGGGRWLQRTLQVAAAAAVAVGAAAASLPSVVSSEWGLQRAVEVLNGRMPERTRLEVAGAKLSWRGGNELQYVKVFDGPQLILSLGNVSTSKGLLHICRGGDYNLVIKGSWINAIYDTKLADFKLIHFLEEVGVLSKPPPPPPRKPAQPDQPAPQPPQQDEAREAAAGGSSGRGPAGERGPEDGKGRGGGGGGGGGGDSGGKIVEVLTRINSKMVINADVRMGRMNLVVADSLLLVPEEIRQILGPSVHVTGAIGRTQLREWAGEVGEDASWAESPETSATSGPLSVPGAAGRQAAAGPLAPALAYRPPADVLKRPHAYEPGVMQFHSQHLVGEMRLWDADDHSILHQPATARLELTPALSRLGLATANPLLGDVVQVQGGAGGPQGVLHATFSPDGGRLPYTAATAEMAPVTLSLGPGSLATGVLSDLGLRGLSRSAPLAASLSRMTVHFSRDGQVRTERVDMRLGGAASAAMGPSAPADAEGAAAAAVAAGQDEQGGVRLAVWGSADLARDSMDFTVGVAPGPLLSALGLSDEGLPEGYLVLVPLRGSTEGPRYEVAGAVVRVGQLAARQKAQQWEERRRERAERREGRQGLVSSTLGALVDAVGPSERLAASVDRAMREDLARTPPARPEEAPAVRGPA